MSEKVKVAVVGLGACGLATLKNLRQAGFDAVGFDGNDYVGGLWQYTADAAKTSVLKTTRANLSKQCGCYTDFPYPEETPDYPSAAQVAQYMNDYADHFGLREHMRLGVEVQRIGRKGDKWELRLMETASKTPHSLSFDKVAVCPGLGVQTPKLPNIKGLNTFTGQAMHSNAYKGATPFSRKRVVVVGLGNTGPDTAVDLVGHAESIYLSHRRGNAIFSRWNPQGRPADWMLSLRLVKWGGLINKSLPNFAQRMSVLGMRRIQNQAFDMKPEWNLGVPQMPTRKVPTINEDLVPALHAGKIQLRPGLVEIDGDTLIFSDGSKLSSVDAIIFCTGFRSDYSLLDPAVDPTRDTRKDWPTLPGADHRPLPRLYQGIISLDFPDSLAFLGTSPLTPQACLNYDISSAAVAQIWLGKSALPAVEDMKRHVDAQHELVCNLARTGELANTNLRNHWEWYCWCDEAAGIGLVKRMGYAVEGWRFWWSDRTLCRSVMDGVMSPHLFALFDEGKRKPWPGARRVLEEVNARTRGG